MKVENGTSGKLCSFNEFELEQHDAEIRKPLEEEIKKIKSTRMPASIPDGVALHYKQENAVINKAKQEVINELLEWIKKEDNYHSKFDYGAQEVMRSVSQKLNEMKGGNNEKEYNI